MKTIVELEAAKSAALAKAKGVCDLAAEEGREFTPSEAGQVMALQDEAKSLDAQIRAVKGDEALRQAVLGIAGGDGRHGAAGVKSVWGDAFIKGLAPFQSQLHGAKQLITPSGSVGVPSLSDVIPAVGERLESILQVIPVTPLATASVEYLREVTRTNRAAAVADSDTKPTSTYELEEINSPAQVIAHLTSPSPRRWFDDQTNLRRYLDTVLRLGLQLALEQEILTGSGVAPHLEGMLTVVGHQHQAWYIDILRTARAAITLIQLVNLPTDGLVFCMHPARWEECETAVDLVDGFQLKGQSQNVPVDKSKMALWGVPVALSMGLDECTAILFHRQAVELKERQGVTIDWSENTYDSFAGKTDFERNLIRFRAEGRWAFNVYNPPGIVELDLCLGS